MVIINLLVYSPVLSRPFQGRTRINFRTYRKYYPVFGEWLAGARSAWLPIWNDVDENVE